MCQAATSHAYFVTIPVPAPTSVSTSSAVSLLCTFLHVPGGYESCQSRLIKIIDRMTHIRERDIPAEYLYYGIPSPWLQAGAAGLGV